MLKKILFLTRPVRYWLDGLFFVRSKKSTDLVFYKDACKGKPLLIVGNGPSLNKTPLDDFSGVYSIGMNKIDMLFDRVSWRPDLIVSSNNLVVKQHSSKMISNNIPCLLSWKSRWFIPKKNRSKFTFFLTKNDTEFNVDFSRGVGGSGTVTYTALQLAYYLGANPVVVVGVDHSFVSDGKPNEIKKREGVDSNHFDPNYFSSGQYWGVPNLDASEEGYLKARKHFEADGRNVYDATVGGKLDVFEKITIDQALSIVLSK